MTRRLLLFTSLALPGSLVFLLTSLGWSQTGANASAPAADISNGQLRARLWLPDPEKGFYRGTRFDWSGSIANLSYQGHTYFGAWFVRYDPAVHDVAWIPGNNGYAAGKASADVGPVEEFTGPGNSAPGYDEAKPGGTFLRIGVGALRKPLDGKEGKFIDLRPGMRIRVHTKKGDKDTVLKIEALNGYACADPEETRGLLQRFYEKTDAGRAGEHSTSL